jgi:hypothetical protein
VDALGASRSRRRVVLRIAGVEVEGSSSGKEARDGM